MLFRKQAREKKTKRGRRKREDVKKAAEKGEEGVPAKQGKWSLTIGLAE